MAKGKRFPKIYMEPTSNDQFIPISPYVHNLYVFVPFQLFTKFGDKDIHTTGTKKIVVPPECLQYQGTVQDLVLVPAQMKEQMCFPVGKELFFLIFVLKRLFWKIEIKVPNGQYFVFLL